MTAIEVSAREAELLNDLGLTTEQGALASEVSKFLETLATEQGTPSPLPKAPRVKKLTTAELLSRMAKSSYENPSLINSWLSTLATNERHTPPSHASDAEALAVWALPEAPASERMQPLELMATREALGLTREVLADALGVSVSAIRVWERGSSPIPERVRHTVEHLEAYTDALAATLATHLTKGGGPEARTIGAYTRDDQLPPIPLPEAPFTPTARWWRVVAYRTSKAVRGARITSGSSIMAATHDTADMVVDGTPVQIKSTTNSVGHASPTSSAQDIEQPADTPGA